MQLPGPLVQVKKKSISKKNLIFKGMELSCPKKQLNKTFLKFLAQKNLIKNIYRHSWTNSLRRIWMLEQPLLFTGCSSIQNKFPKLLS